MNRIFRHSALGWVALLVVVPMLAGCSWRGPEMMDGHGRDGHGMATAGVDEEEFSSLESRVSELEERMSANEDLAETANLTAEKALKCCRKDYTIIMTEEIYFDFNKFDVTSASHAALDRVAAKLKSDPDLIAELAGHTDAVGTTDYNIVLGQKRADAARQYLVSKQQIKLGRLALRTYGEDAPIAANDDDTGRGKNRRVTIDVLGFAP